MKTAINLLPLSLQRQLVARRRAYQWGVILAVGLLLGGIVRLGDVRAHQAKVERLDLLVREHEPTQRMLRQLVDMRHELAELQQLEQVATELEHQRPALFLLGLLSEIGEQTGGKLRITKLELTGLQQFDPANRNDTAGAGGSGVLISGVSLDNQSVAKLQSGLWESAFFSEVELVKSTESGEEGRLMREYQLRCQF
jgi:Tfp pilus assembly protein PilN